MGREGGWEGRNFKTEAYMYVICKYMQANRFFKICIFFLYGWNCVWTEKPTEVDSPHSMDVLLMTGKEMFLLSVMGEMWNHIISD